MRLAIIHVPLHLTLTPMCSHVVRVLAGTLQSVTCRTLYYRIASVGQHPSAELMLLFTHAVMCAQIYPATDKHGRPIVLMRPRYAFTQTCMGAQYCEGPWSMS